MKKCFAYLPLFLLLFSRGDSVERVESCPFCDEEVLENQTFYTGREVLGIGTHQPAVDGHVLIIPIRHVERFDELRPSEIAEMGEVIQKINLVVRDLYGTSGYLLLQKNGREAGQSVFHAHFHYIPAREDGSQIALILRILTASLFPPLSRETMALRMEALAQAMAER